MSPLPSLRPGYSTIQPVVRACQSFLRQAGIFGVFSYRRLRGVGTGRDDAREDISKMGETWELYSFGDWTSFVRKLCVTQLVAGSGVSLFRSDLFKRLFPEVIHVLLYHLELLRDEIHKNRIT